MPETAKALLVALTGYAGAGREQEARQAGCDHFLLKPVDPEGLWQLLGGTRGDGATEARAVPATALRRRRSAGSRPARENPSRRLADDAAPRPDRQHLGDLRQWQQPGGAVDGVGGR